MNPKLRDWTSRSACALFPGRPDEALSLLESLREFDSSTLRPRMRPCYAEGRRVCVCVLSASVNLCCTRRCEELLVSLPALTCLSCELNKAACEKAAVFILIG